jgi:hypothetical protein
MEAIDGLSDWTCVACDAVNSNEDAECQYCECGGDGCRRDVCSDAEHFPAAT